MKGHDSLKDIDNPVECPACYKLVNARRHLSLHYLTGCKSWHIALEQLLKAPFKVSFSSFPSMLNKIRTTDIRYEKLQVEQRCHLKLTRLQHNLALIKLIFFYTLRTFGWRANRRDLLHLSLQISASLAQVSPLPRARQGEVPLHGLRQRDQVQKRPSCK